MDVDGYAPYHDTVRTCTNVSVRPAGRQAVHVREAPFVDQVRSIPNIPFFWFAFRTYSHYRALYGGRLLEHITNKGMVQAKDSRVMDELYAAGLLKPSRQAVREATKPGDTDIEKVVKQAEEQAKEGKKEVVLLQGWNGKLIADAFHLSEMEVEIERAVEQVENAIKKTDEQARTAKEVERATEQKTEALKDETKQ